MWGVTTESAQGGSCDSWIEPDITLNSVIDILNNSKY